MIHTEFCSGLNLSRHFYEDEVRPLLNRLFPGVPYSCGLLGEGSEVLGFDIGQSTDHCWGPRCLIFLDEQALGDLGDSMRETLCNNLPPVFRGYSVNFTKGSATESPVPEFVATGPINHRVVVTSVRKWITEYIGFDPRGGISEIQWLTTPGQKLRSISEGAVFHDGLEELVPLQSSLGWYPKDVWCAMMAANWTRIAQEEPFMVRAAMAQDEIGSRIITARLVHIIMHQAFLQERRYAPYSKHFGRAFQQLPCYGKLNAYLSGALTSADPQHREDFLCSAYTILAEMHNRLNLTLPLHEGCSPFHGRPIRVLHAERFAAVLRAEVHGHELCKYGSIYGGLEQVTTSTDLLEATDMSERFARVYQDLTDHSGESL